MRPAAPLLWTLVALGALAALSAGALGLTQGLGMALEGPEQRPLLENGTAQFNFTFWVTGEGSWSNVAVDLLDEPEGWAHSLTANTSTGVESSNGSLSLKVGVGSPAPCTLTFAIDHLPLMGDYAMAVLATLLDVTNVSARLNVTVSVPRRTDLAIVHVNPPVDEQYAGMPESVVTVQVAVFNRGNGPDPIHLELECTMADSGWRTWCDDGVDEDGWTPELPADPEGRRPYIVSVMTLIPEGERAGTLAQLFVNATARSNASVQTRPAYARILCLQYFQFTAYLVTGPDLEVGPGEVSEGYMHVQNTGNGPDRISMGLEWTGSDDVPVFAAPNPRSVELGPGEEADLACVVRAESTARVGTFFLTATVTSTGPACLPIVRFLTVTVVQRFRVDLDFDPAEVAAAPGGTAEFLGRVSNDGNGLDRVTVSYDGPEAGWPVDVFPEVVTLEPWTWAAVLVRVQVPADLEGATISRQGLNVTVASVLGGGGVTVGLVVRVDGFTRLEWRHGGGRLTSPASPTAALNGCQINPYSRTLEWGTTGLALLSVGNVPTVATLSVWCSHPEAEAIVYPTYVELQPLEDRAVTVTVRLPMGAAPGEHLVVLNASVADAPDAHRTVGIPLAVVEVDLALDPVIWASGPEVGDHVGGNATTLLGATVTLHVTVLNVGTANVSDAVLHIEHTGVRGGPRMLDSYPIRLGAGRNQTLTYTWLAEGRGEHGFDAYIELPDQSRTGNDRASLVVTVVAAAGPDGLDIDMVNVVASLLALLAFAVLVVSMASTVRQARGKARAGRKPVRRRPR